MWDTGTIAKSIYLAGHSHLFPGTCTESALLCLLGELSIVDVSRKGRITKALSI